MYEPQQPEERPERDSESGDAPRIPGSPSRGPDVERPAESAFVRFGLLFYGAMMAAALVWRVGFYGESILFASAEAEAQGLRLQRDLLVGLVAGAGVVIASHVMTTRTGWGDRLARGLAESLGPISLPNALLLAMASGLGEELFFRGALQPRVGIVLASILFGAVHFVPRRDMVAWSGFAVTIGLLFGLMFEWTGSVVAPVVAHTVVNGVNLPYLTRRYGGGPGR